MSTEQALSIIAADIELANLVIAFGSTANKRKAKKHLAVCKAAIDDLCPISDKFARMTDDELLAALSA